MQKETTLSKILGRIWTVQSVWVNSSFVSTFR